MMSLLGFIILVETGTITFRESLPKLDVNFVINLVPVQRNSTMFDDSTLQKKIKKIPCVFIWRTPYYYYVRTYTLLLMLPLLQTPEALFIKCKKRPLVGLRCRSIILYGLHPKTGSIFF
jgi:hypothetical protein